MTGPDAALLMAERDFMAALDALRCDPATEEEERALEPANAACWDRINEARKVAAHTEAKTLEGVAAQLRIVLHPHIGIEGSENGTDITTLKNVLAIVERLAGDAALVDAWRELKTLLDEINAEQHTDEDGEVKGPIRARQRALQEIILTTAATTTAGVLAKLEFAWSWESHQGHEHQAPECYVFDALQDLRRVVGGAAS